MSTLYLGIKHCPSCEELSKENQQLRARVEEFERCDTLRPDATGDVYGAMLRSLEQLHGRIDTISADASTAARMAGEVYRNVGEAVRTELSCVVEQLPDIVRSEIDRVMRDTVARLNATESEVKGLTERRCTSCVFAADT